jgi:ABC-type Fe3+/spermidine/putrescine transport system ATPase subunit
VSNLMPGTVRKSGENGEVELDSGVQVRTAVDGFQQGERCHAVVRPEKLAIDSSNGDQPSVEGLVESSIYLGTSTQLIVQLPGDVRMTVLVQNTDEAERQRLPGGGAKVKLSWAPDHMHVVRESDTNRAVPTEMAAETA